MLEAYDPQCYSYDVYRITTNGVFFGAQCKRAGSHEFGKQIFGPGDNLKTYEDACARVYEEYGKQAFIISRYWRPA